jgi:hypothetical protein
MSGAVIDLLNACTERPGIPLFAAFEQALPDKGEELAAAEGDFTAPDLSEIDSAQTELAEGELNGVDPAEDPRPGADADQMGIPADTQASNRNSDLWLYRDRTVALLRRYLRLSIEVGRMPSLLGREFFRTRVTSYGASTFEDSVIFVHDVERSLQELNEFEKKLIAKIVLQRFSKEEAGRLLGCGYRTVERLFPEALDRVSEIFLKRRILTGLPSSKREVPKTCQEGKTGPFLGSD